MADECHGGCHVGEVKACGAGHHDLRQEAQLRGGNLGVFFINQFIFLLYKENGKEGRKIKKEKEEMITKRKLIRTKRRRIKTQNSVKKFKVQRHIR